MREAARACLVYDLDEILEGGIDNGDNPHVISGANCSVKGLRSGGGQILQFLSSSSLQQSLYGASVLSSVVVLARNVYN